MDDSLVSGRCSDRVGVAASRTLHAVGSGASGGCSTILAGVIRAGVVRHFSLTYNYTCRGYLILGGIVKVVSNLPSQNQSESRYGGWNGPVG